MKYRFEENIYTGCPKSHLPKVKFNISTFPQRNVLNFFLIEREIPKSLFSFQINRIAYPISIKIQIVLLMAKLESLSVVIRKCDVNIAVQYSKDIRLQLSIKSF